MGDLLYLNGYGFYVWGSYVVTFALLAIELVVLRNRTYRKLSANETAP
jgi:heme exporter protein CcmD